MVCLFLFLAVSICGVFLHRRIDLFNVVLSQVPFARYIARRGISYLKRYSVDNVYRESRLVGLHPRELAACSFDIVTSASGQSVIADAEVVAVVSEIVNEVPSLGARNCRLRVNHTALVKAMLLHCGVAESLHADVYAILGDSKVCNQSINQSISQRVVSAGTTSSWAAWQYKSQQITVKITTNSS